MFGPQSVSVALHKGKTLAPPHECGVEASVGGRGTAAQSAEELRPHPGSCLPHKVLEWSCRALEDRPGLPRGWRWKILRKAGPGEGPHAAIAASLALGQSSAQ